jgi:hypothetical protein
MKLTVVISHLDTPKSLNAGGAGSRRHWGAAYREKKEWEDIWSMLLHERQVPQGMAHLDIRVLFEFRHKYRRDVSNYEAPLVKPFADAMVSGLWLADDTAEFFTVKGMELMTGLEHPNPAVKGRTTITLDATYK